MNHFKKILSLILSYCLKEDIYIYLELVLSDKEEVQYSHSNTLHHSYRVYHWPMSQDRQTLNLPRVLALEPFSHNTDSCKCS